MRYAHPGQPGAVVSFKSAYGNFIDGRGDAANLLI